MIRMMGRSIRSRVLWVALLPVTLVAMVLALVFIFSRMEDLQEAHGQRARLLARQLASASEYGMFSANKDSLQAVASGGLREEEIRSVTVLDAQQGVLVRVGQAGYATLPVLTEHEQNWFDAHTGLDVYIQPVLEGQVPLDDLFAQHVGMPQLLGHVVLEVSRVSLWKQERQMVLTGLAVTVGGLLLGALLALRISRSVLQPIRRVSDMVEQIGQGDLSVRAEVRADEPLRQLQQGLNAMAASLQQGRDELEQRIAAATLELRAKKEEAEDAAQAKSRFLAAASHDLRQPLHALGMFVARLAQLPQDQETRHLVANLDVSVRAMQDLLDALLDMSKLESGTVRVYVRPFALNELLESLRNDLQGPAQDKGLEVRLRGCPAWVRSDPVLLHRVLLNLASNALRYTRRGGVLLACRPGRDGQHLRVEVWDTGIGIAQEHQQDIFKEYFQIGNEERDRNKGLGLGLSIVERTVSLLGHRLELRSRLGRGTRFTLELPLAQAVVAAPVAEPVTATMTGLVGLRVLVLEDDELVATALTSLLESWGCRVMLADDAASAHARLTQAGVPDVIVSDYRLRSTDHGIAVVQQLRARAGRDIPACLMSGDTDAGVMQLAQEAGLTLLHKPVRPAKLRTLLRRLTTPEPDSAGAVPGERLSGHTPAG